MSSDRTTEILNLLSAISREVGAFRAETQERFAQVDARFERLETDMREFRAEMNEMRSEITEMHAEIREIRNEVHIIAARLSRIYDKAQENRDDIRDLKPRVAALEGKT